MAAPTYSIGRWARVSLLSAAICQVSFLFVAARANRHLLNPDAICYMRSACNYASGHVNWAVNGWFGPMLSWLMVPMLGVVGDPPAAARVVTALSAVVFLLGTIRLLLRLQLSPPWVVLGAWATALSTIYWSVMVIAPDLLFAGILFFATAEMISPQWIDGWRSPVVAGALAGLSYLAKPVGFATSLILFLGVGGLWIVSRSAKPAAVFASVRTTVLAFLLIALPWITVLTVKYGRVVITTSSGAAHALVGPGDKYRYFPVELRRPDPGRLFWDEDMVRTTFLTWSPFESRYYAKHQARVIYTNAEKIIGFLGGFDTLHLGLASAVLGLLVHAPWAANLRAQRWRWSGALAAFVCAIYLPVYAEDFRYYLVAYPFVFAAAAGMVASLTFKAPTQWNVTWLIGFGLVAISFLDVSRGTLREAFRGLDDPVSSCAHDLAIRLPAKGFRGPIAGAGDYSDQWNGEAIGIYLAFLLNEPYYGSDPHPSPEHYKALGPALVVINRQSQAVEKLSHDNDFVDLDRVLFASRTEADQFPVKVFQQGHEPR